MLRGCRVYLTTLVLLVTLVGASSLGNAGPSTERVLRFSPDQSDLSRGFDPIATSGPDIDIGREIYSYLFRVDRGSPNLRIVVDLAESWTWSNAGTLLRITLRQNVHFHKGFGELTADDVLFSLKRLISPESQFAFDFNAVKEIRAVSDRIVEVVLSRPDADLLIKLADVASAPAAILSRKAVEKFGRDYRFNPIGSGPFEFVVYRPQDRVVLKRFDDFYGPRPQLDGIEYVFVPDPNNRMRALQQGLLDMIKLDDVKLIRTLRGQAFKSLPGPIEVQYLYMNMARPPFNDRRVREAVMYAVDLKEIAGAFSPLYAFDPPARVWQKNLSAYRVTDGLPSYEYNPNKAQELLREAGYDQGLKVSSKWPSSPETVRDAALIMQAQMKKAGIDWSLEFVPFGLFYQWVLSKQYELAYLRTSRALELELPTMYFHSAAAIAGGDRPLYNFSNYENKTVDTLIDRAAREVNPSRRTQLFAEIQRQIMRDLPVIPYLSGTAGMYLASPRVDLGYSYQSLDNRYPFFTPMTRVR